MQCCPKNDKYKVYIVLVYNFDEVHPNGCFVLAQDQMSVVLALQKLLVEKVQVINVG